MYLRVFIAFLVIILIRATTLFPLRREKRQRSRLSSETCSLAIFLGSGGHTSEALALLSAIDFQRYTPRTYVISQGDSLSSQKAHALELEKAKNSSSPNYKILSIPRARRVHQSLLTTPATALWSMLISGFYVTLHPLLSGQWTSQSIFADVLILNGPGSCVALCFAIYINKFLGLPTPKIIYVESFARVRTLSLSGKVLHPFVDRFVLQWPQDALSKTSENRGWLV